MDATNGLGGVTIRTFSAATVNAGHEEILPFCNNLLSSRCYLDNTVAQCTRLQWFIQESRVLCVFEYLALPKVGTTTFRIRINFLSPVVE